MRGEHWYDLFALPIESFAECTKPVVQNRPKGRPLKRNSSKNAVEKPSTATPIKGAKSKSRSLKHLKSKRSMSALEKLPVELLENIFLHCMNLDLPRASPVIGGNLSSKLIYSRTLMAAFSPTWQTWHSVSRDRRHQKDISGADVDLQVSDYHNHVSDTSD